MFLILIKQNRKKIILKEWDGTLVLNNIKL